MFMVLSNKDESKNIDYSSALEWAKHNDFKVLSYNKENFVAIDVKHEIALSYGYLKKPNDPNQIVELSRTVSHDPIDPALIDIDVASSNLKKKLKADLVILRIPECRQGHRTIKSQILVQINAEKHKISDMDMVFSKMVKMETIKASDLPSTNKWLNKLRNEYTVAAI